MFWPEFDIPGCMVQEACERTQEAIQAAKEAAAQKGEQRAHLQAELRQLEGSSGSVPGPARPQASVSFVSCQTQILPKELHSPPASALSLRACMCNGKRPA